MAPEMLQNQKFNEKIDVWGAGCILCFLLLDRLPNNGSKGGFDSPYNFLIEADICKEPAFNRLEKGEQDLLSGLLAMGIDDRLSAKNALVHPWLLDE